MNILSSKCICLCIFEIISFMETRWCKLWLYACKLRTHCCILFVSHFCLTTNSILISRTFKILAKFKLQILGVDHWLDIFWEFFVHVLLRGLCVVLRLLNIAHSYISTVCKGLRLLVGLNHGSWCTRIKVVHRIVHNHRISVTTLWFDISNLLCKSFGCWRYKTWLLFL